MMHKRHFRPVLVAPIDPALPRRHDLALPGVTIAAIVDAQFPDAPDDVLDHLTVTLVTDRGVWVVDRAAWRVTRPAERVTIVIRQRPGKQALRGLLQIVVSIAAMAIGQYWAMPALAGLGFGAAAAGAGAALVTAGLTAVGELQLNVLVPCRKTEHNRVAG